MRVKSLEKIFWNRKYLMLMDSSIWKCFSVIKLFVEHLDSVGDGIDSVEALAFAFVSEFLLLKK